MINPSPDQIERLALNNDWTSNIIDPRNAVYLIPFGNTEREAEARAMADWAYSAASDRFTDATSQIEADAVYFQCLIDARRMIVDPDYWQLFVSGRRAA